MGPTGLKLLSKSSNKLCDAQVNTGEDWSQSLLLPEFWYLIEADVNSRVFFRKMLHETRVLLYQHSDRLKDLSILVPSIPVRIIDFSWMESPLPSCAFAFKHFIHSNWSISDIPPMDPLPQIDTDDYCLEQYSQIPELQNISQVLVEVAVKAGRWGQRRSMISLFEIP